LRPKYNGLGQADSFVLDPHKWLFTPFDCCAVRCRDPEPARATHTQDASYLDVIHTSDGDPNPSDNAYHLTRRAATCRCGARSRSTGSTSPRHSRPKRPG
jgi:glutamate/tyrosine decarboxylase-like PLP-dependent enzyme